MSVMPGRISDAGIRVSRQIIRLSRTPASIRVNRRRVA
jgi:hypothetical protein